MNERVLIDGNNLLYTMHTHAPVPPVGRETMIRILDRWARLVGADVTVVFDGPKPAGGLANQMATSRVHVSFSAPETADDVVLRALRGQTSKADLRAVSSDTAIRKEASRGGVRCVDSASFVAEIFAVIQPGKSTKPQVPSPRPDAAGGEKPADTRSTDEWLEWLHVDDDEAPAG